MSGMASQSLLQMDGWMDVVVLNILTSSFFLISFLYRSIVHTFVNSVVVVVVVTAVSPST